jgi:hypothetical protein
MQRLARNMAEVAEHQEVTRVTMVAIMVTVRRARDATEEKVLSLAAKVATTDQR